MSKLRRPQLKNYRLRIFNRYTVLKNFLALSLLFAGFMLISAALLKVSNPGRLFVVFFGVIVLILAKILIVEFALKTFRAQVDPSIVRYSALTSVNAFFGLIMPLLYINVTLLYVIRALSWMPKVDTVWCQLRQTLVSMYYSNNIYWHLNSLIFIILLMVVALFIWGGALEKMRRK